MQRESRALVIRFSFSWQRLLATLLFVIGALVLGYGLIRPRVSEYVGEQVSQQINEELAREVVAALVGEIESAQAPAQGEAQGSPAATGAQSGSAPQPAASAQGQQPAQTIVIVGGQGGQAGAPAGVDSGSILRAIVGTEVPTTEAGAPAAAAPEAQAPIATAQAGAPGAAVGDPVGGAAPLVPTPVLATPISSPDPGRSIEGIVEDLPSGEITVTEAKLNEKIAGRAAALGPIDRLVVRFVPGSVQVTLTVLGQDTIATSGLTVVNGRVASENPQISGALGMVISVTDLARPIEEELNAILDTAGRAVKAVRIEQGKIVVTMD